MKLTQNQIQQYENDGMLFIPNYLSKLEINSVNKAIFQLPDNTPGLVMEKDCQTIRALHGVYTYSEIFQDLIRHPFLLEPAQQILGDSVYLYQFKINMKAAFTGDLWPWHQDYAFWYKEDGMPEPRTVSIGIFLDEVNQFNGPLYYILGSHKEGLIEFTIHGSREDAGWEDNVSADLKYCLDNKTITRLVEKGGLTAPTGSAGSVFFFHGNIAHASVPNISPYPRRLLIITYNSINNIPRYDKQRPEFLVSKNYTPLEPVVRNNILLQQI
jgi:Phytanoyl-CoA dioxygenase (PhyH)